jgi:hypothetical protein
MAGDESLARLIEAARDLVDAYRRKATANEHFEALERAVEGLGGAQPGGAKPSPGEAAGGPSSTPAGATGP